MSPLRRGSAAAMRRRTQSSLRAHLANVNHSSHDAEHDVAVFVEAAAVTVHAPPAPTAADTLEVLLAGRGAGGAGFRQAGLGTVKTANAHEEGSGMRRGHGRPPSDPRGSPEGGPSLLPGRSPRIRGMPGVLTRVHPGSPPGASSRRARGVGLIRGMTAFLPRRSAAPSRLHRRPPSDARPCPGGESRSSLG